MRASVSRVFVERVHDISLSQEHSSRINVCTAANASARAVKGTSTRSFPSGHSSESMAGTLYVTLVCWVDLSQNTTARKGWRRSLCVSVRGLLQHLHSLIVADIARGRIYCVVFCTQVFARLRAKPTLLSKVLYDLHEKWSLCQNARL